MTIFKWLWILIGAAALSACEPVDNLVAPAVDRHLARSQEKTEKSLSMLRQEISSLRKTYQELNTKIVTLEFHRTLLQSQIEGFQNSPATLNDEGKYGIARTTLGPTPISIENIQPYLDGYRVKFHVGNLTVASLNGAEFEVAWGLPWDIKTATYEQISASQKKKKFSVTTTF
ncbi:MAG: hypothetical protein AB7E67_03615, partial [Xanthobacteraceae bacterium]